MNLRVMQIVFFKSSTWYDLYCWLGIKNHFHLLIIHPPPLPLPIHSSPFPSPLPPPPSHHLLFPVDETMFLLRLIHMVYIIRFQARRLPKLWGDRWLVPAAVLPHGWFSHEQGHLLQHQHLQQQRCQHIIHGSCPPTAVQVSCMFNRLCLLFSF